ncbi:hypothetical protein [Phenylobacterium sp.]|uniref:hypothetical protein n=1 Tax=Phenylobacterium sp. TaxID=1871053 RepID=UPI0030F426DA
MPTDLVWPHGWAPVEDAQERGVLEAELARECSSAHVLHKATAALIARHQKTDDCLFALEDGRVAQVHLTWSTETKPDFPWTEIYPSFSVWARHPANDA